MAFLFGELTRAGGGPVRPRGCRGADTSASIGPAGPTAWVTPHSAQRGNAISASVFNITGYLNCPRARLQPTLLGWLDPGPVPGTPFRAAAQRRFPRALALGPSRPRKTLKGPASSPSLPLARFWGPLQRITTSDILLSHCDDMIKKAIGVKLLN